jgi:hypothetical protein
MTNFKTLIESCREVRRIERHIKYLARKSLRAGLDSDHRRQNRR